jgi:hypothetical protein
MSDPLRTDPSHALGGAPEPDREAKIEQLLLTGLDHYFAAQYEQAINVWTRALFLDRSHARARAYIERARSALAERQRESEELLQNGVAAFNRGEGDEARRLLQAAMTRGAPPDEAQAVLDRLSRLEQGSVVSRPAAPARAESRWQMLPGPRGRESARTPLFSLLMALAVVLASAAAFIVLTSTPLDWRGLLNMEPARPAPSTTAFLDPAPAVPLRGEMALARARAFAATGRLRDALTSLEAVRPTDPQKEEADRLRADLQRQIMTLSAIPSTATEPALPSSSSPEDDPPIRQP